MSSIYYCTVFVKDKRMCPAATFTHTAVNDVSFSIDKGRIYGFLGPNGAGKTTTMNIITGYLAATCGQVTVNGYDILKEPEKAKKSVC